MPWVDFLIVLFLGPFGVHKFMQKKTGMGVIYLCTIGLFCFGWLYDCFIYCKAAMKGERITGCNSYIVKRIRDDEPLPIVVTATVPLQKDEVCHYVGIAKYQTTKNVVTGYTGKSAGVNIRIAKGVTYRTGGHGSQAIRGDVVEQTQGTLTVTNKRVIFTASKGAFESKFSKLASIEPHVDGIIIQVGSKAYTLITKEAKFIYQIIMRASSDSEE